MPRRSSSGGRSASRLAPRPAPARNPPPVNHAPASAPVPSRGGGLVNGGIGSAIVDGMAIGAGSSIGHRAVDAMMGPRTIRHETVVVSEPTAAPPTSNSNTVVGGADFCNNHHKAFQDCLNNSGSDISKCQFYMDMLNECRRNSGSMISA